MPASKSSPASEPDDLKPRKAAKIVHHLTGCAAVHCSSTPALRRARPCSPASLSRRCPANLSARIDTALAARSGSARPAPLPPRPAAAICPSGRRAGRSRRGADRAAGGCLACLSRATRVLAAAGALVIIGGGGYEIAAHVGAARMSRSSPPALRQCVRPRRLSVAAVSRQPVSYGHGADARSIRDGDLRHELRPGHARLTQAIAALDAAQAEGCTPVPVHSTLAPVRSARSSSSRRDFPALALA